MKRLLFINGTMGVGKTTVSQLLKQELDNSVFLDGDWCWDASPFVVNKETKEMVVNNITTLLNNFLNCSAYTNSIFCWVMDDMEIIEAIQTRITVPHDFYCFTLLCQEEQLVARLQKDIEEGKRNIDILERSVQRIHKYKKMKTIHIDVTSSTVTETVNQILKKLEI